MTRTTTKRIGAALAAGAASLALGLGSAGIANATIHPVDTSCSNPAGHQPGGQQPSCQNDNLTQDTENQNPAGHAPGGWNK
ncbi:MULTISPECIES: hypothetical protein [Streptomyces]|uniref:Intersectin-EH binding protein Ibp1 n=1 Tax=Streptomyces xanthii TaxID=2768069 RepID=A0A7H1B8E2_9ACTN|nr:hypothetical protein [Streptomyces xanthii]QNS04997.1 hypothetical protein IAG42_16185 [Streptomyces xanthii]